MKRLSMLLLVSIALFTIAPACFATCFYCSVYQDCFMAGGSAARCYSYGTSCMTSGHCDSDQECQVGSGCGPDVAFARPVTRPLDLDYHLAAVKISHPATAASRAMIAEGNRSRSPMERN